MKFNIKTVNGEELQAFIKKLLPIDKFIFLKITNEKIISSVYFPERDAVKLVNVPTSDVFEGLENLDKPIKMSFYNGGKVIDASSHFIGAIQGTIEIDSSTVNSDEYMASSFIMSNDELKIDLVCTDPSLAFMEMTEDEIKRAFGVDSKMFSFVAAPTQVDKLKSLFKLDKDEPYFTVLSNESNSVSIKGKNYDIDLLVECKGDVGRDVLVNKKYLDLLDKEHYTVVVCENKVVFKSMDSNTLLTVAVAIDDE